MEDRNTCEPEQDPIPLDLCRQLLANEAEGCPMMKSNWFGDMPTLGLTY